MKTVMTTSLKLVLATITAVVLIVPVAEAKDRGNRGNGSVEFSVPINYTTPTTINGSNGATVELSDSLSSGFGLGYNVSDNLQFNGQFTWGYRNYKGQTVGDAGTITKYSGTIDTSSVQLNAVYYFLDGDFTPLVSGGFGNTFVDSNIPSGGSTDTCYWDPYWGYVCGTYVPTKSSINVSYNLGLGARMDLGKQFALQGGVYRMWINSTQSSGAKPEIDMVRIDLIFRM
jgi:Outer membrane protein beta-barrel domain